MEQGFIAKKRWMFPQLPDDDYGYMDKLFLDSDKYVYFIEDETTRKWLTKEHEWTLDPLKALSFKSDMKARTYAVENKFTGWIITEHEFI